MELTHPHQSNWDFSQIDDYIFVGADLCCDNDHYDFLVKQMGIKADIDLQIERFYPPAPVLEEFLWLPTKDMTAPTKTQLLTGAATLDTLVKQKQRVFVHCLNGHGRSPTLVASYYVLKQDLSFDEAIAKIKRARPEIHLNEEQRQAVKSLVGES